MKLYWTFKNSDSGEIYEGDISNNTWEEVQQTLKTLFDTLGATEVTLSK